MSRATAQTPQTGISVSPGIVNLTLGSGVRQQTVPVTITNSYAAPVVLSAGFQAIDERAGLLIPNGALDADLGANIRLSQTDIRLPARGSVTIRVQVDNGPGLSPGGHYAALVLTQQNAGGKQLTLKASISLAVFVVKSDGAREDLRATDLASDGWLFHLPTMVTLKFVNRGNVHVVPRASIDMLGRRGTQIAHGVANQASLPILPDKMLVSQTTVTKPARVWLPSHVRLVATYRPDGSDTTRIISSKLWYVPPLYPILFILVASCLVYRWHRSRRHRETTPKKSSINVSLASEPQRISVIQPETVETPTMVTPKSPGTPVLIVVSTPNETDAVSPEIPVAKPAAVTKKPAKPRARTKSKKTTPKASETTARKPKSPK